MDVPPQQLDRRIAAAARDVGRETHALRREGPAAASDPMRGHRAVSTRSLYLELAEKPDPFRDAARAWVRELTRERVLWPDRARLAAAWHQASLEIERPERLRASPRDLLFLLLSDPAPERRAIWGESLLGGARAVADAARILAERAAEAERLLGEGGDLDVPCDPPGDLAAIAEALLAATDACFEPAGPAWTAAIDRALGRRADEGWPARLTTRWLHDLFAPTGLTDGLRLDPAPLPRALGASSFARALGRFGAAYAEADLPSGAPFVMARRPFDLRVERRAALFASLAVDPVFARRALGLGRDRAREQARELARSIVVTLRLDAARALLRGALEQPQKALERRFEEVTERALGAPIPAPLAGVLPTAARRAPARLFGVLLAALDRRALVERFDEDWFQSPHAAHALRDEQATADPRPLAPRARLDEGLAELARALREALG
jgi:hypothetical protein